MNWITFAILAGSASSAGGAVCLLRRVSRYAKAKGVDGILLDLIWVGGLIFFIIAWFLGFVIGGNVGGALGSKLGEVFSLPVMLLTSTGIALGIALVTFAVFSLFPGITALLIRVIRR